jgi:hypothetical protein
MRVRAWFFALIFPSVVLATKPALCQDEGAKGHAANADVPGPIHERLNNLAGNWDVAIQYKLGEKTHNGTATCEARWILDGRFLKQDYNSKFGDKPFHVIQLLGYDTGRKKTIEIKLDNMSTGVMHNEGSISDDGKVITNVGESLDPATGKPYKLRSVTTIVDADHFTLEWFHIDDQSKADKVVSMSHTRKKS